MSHAFQTQVEQQRTGTAQPQLPAGLIRNFKIAYPPALSEQEKIVERIDEAVSQIDALESWCASELARSATLRQSILKDAFSGKLVPQDPTDEPASKLLKRIQAERAKAAKTTKQKSSASPRPRGRRKLKESV